MGEITKCIVVEKLTKAKKPSSVVDGDIFPHLYTSYCGLLADGITPIFNSIAKSGKWPDLWKVETITVIPKVPNPASLAQCRNISCTNFLSKVMEALVLDKLREEIYPDPIQFGGVKGSGVEHLMVELWEKILGSLETPNMAVSLLGIDYEKAFNRMCHNQCLKQLAHMGASQHSIDLVASFLSKRSMRARIGQELGEGRGISAGSPQGSILGCFLYCATTQQLGKDLVSFPAAATAQASPAPFHSPAGEIGEPPGPDPHYLSLEMSGMGLLDSTAGSANSGYLAETEGQLQDSLLHLRPSRIGRAVGLSMLHSDSSSISTDQSVNNGTKESADGYENLVNIYKYVDDTTVVETIDTTDAPRHISTNTPRSTCRAMYSEMTMKAIQEEASNIGMKVNCGKTQLLLISPPNGYDQSAYIKTEEGRINSEKSLKLLGFVFGQEPNANMHMGEIQRKFRARFWAMIHLRRSGFRGKELFELYAIFVKAGDRILWGDISLNYYKISEPSN